MSFLYQHKTLGSSGRAFRLLKILRPDTSSQCAYEIIETSLDEDVEYEATSYVWGELLSKNRLHLQPADAFLDITSSLANALEYLTKNSQTGHLFIDQICIDQTNPQERNQQVRIMGHIYARAERTLIWLGEETSSSRRLIAPLRFAAVCDAKKPDFQKYSQGVTALLSDSESQPSVRELLSRPWFGRAWTVQEAVLAKSAVFILGSVVFDENALWLVIQRLRNIEEKATKTDNSLESIRMSPGYLLFYQILTLRKQRDNQSDAIHGSFFYSLSVLAPRCGTTVPNDKILAFLGLLRDPRIQLDLDYDVPLELLPVITTKSIINGTGSLEIFAILHRYAEESSPWFNLPSWVPNFAQRLKAEAIYPTYFNASAGHRHHDTSPPPTSDASTLQLSIRGKVIDQISARLPFAEGVPPPVSSRREWDAHKYLAIHDLHQTLQSIWHDTDAPSPTRGRILAAALADGSFAFDAKQRLKCQNGLSDADVADLLATYESLNQNSPTYTSRSQREKHLGTTLRDHTRVAWDRALVVVERRPALGLAHASVRVGDLVAVVHGSKVPLVLRRVEGDRYCLVGQCYLEGVMRGEVVDWAEQDGDVFHLI